MSDTVGPDSIVAIPHVLVRPLPLRVREHPERSPHARVTLVREVLVALAAQHPPILSALRHVTQAPFLAVALDGYARTAAKAAEGLGLAHRRDLLNQDDGLLSVRHDVGDLLALAQLEPARLEEWAIATGILHVVLDRAMSATGTIARATLEQIAPLVPTIDWLVPALVRWTHLRIYEVLFGPFDVAGALIERVPPEWEEAAVGRAAGPSRSLFARAPKDSGHALAYLTTAWWAVRVVQESVNDVARRWHTSQQSRAHAEAKSVEECSCRRTVRRGITEVSALLLSRD
jgi:hypothetical protein